MYAMGNLIRFYDAPAQGMRCIGLGDGDEALCFDFADERNRLLIAGTDGNIYALRVEDIPAGKGRYAKGEWLKKLPALRLKEGVDVSFTAMMVLPAGLVLRSLRGEPNECTVGITMDNGRIFRHEPAAFHSLLKGRPGGRPFAGTDEGNVTIVGMSIAVNGEYLILADTDEYVNLVATEVDETKDKYTRMVKGNIGKRMLPDAKCIGAVPHAPAKAVAAVSTDGRILRMRFKDSQYSRAEVQSAKYRFGLTAMKGLKTGSSRALAAVCDAGEDSVLFAVTSDGHLNCVKSSRYAVSRNNIKGNKLLKLRPGARAAAVRAYEEG